MFTNWSQCFSFRHTYILKMCSKCVAQRIKKKPSKSINIINTCLLKTVQYLYIMCVVCVNKICCDFHKYAQFQHYILLIKYTLFIEHHTIIFVYLFYVYILMTAHYCHSSRHVMCVLYVHAFIFKYMNIWSFCI